MATLTRIAKATEMRIVTPVAGRAVPRGCHRVTLARRYRMTGLTGNIDVAAGQREIGLNVVVERPHRPVAGTVAGFTLRPEATAVGIITTMTIDAVLGGVMKCGCGVTAVAGYVRVQADQRETSEVMLETHVRRPRELPVAVFASCPDLAGMWIVIDMAPAAVPRQRILDVIDVARGAFQRLVRSQQCETAGLEMLERHGFPARYLVTGSTIRAVTPMMHVVLDVAGVTVVALKAGKIIRGMTVLAT